jgi:hypothetical protein
MKKALSVAINSYIGAPLKGCVNDSNNIKQWLEQQGFEVVTLHESEATKSSIIVELINTLASLGPDDSFIFHYSGHGSQIPTNDASEEDHLTEILCPYDLVDQAGNWTSNFITDDELASIFSNAPCRVECFLDCCHSGSATRDFRPTIVSRFLQSPVQREVAVKKFELSSKSSAICWSGCMDSQTSADAFINNTYQGAFTAALLQSAGTRTQRHFQLVEYMRIHGFSQVPQLYCPTNESELDIF